jgi:hypothetical protein
MEKENNLKLWDKVEKTNPDYTKKANVKGNQITSIAPQYQIKQATEQFGSYGEKWGFRTMEFDYTLANIGMLTFTAVFYYPNGEFPIVNSVQLFKDGAQTKIDDDFAKKVETDTLTKALSKLGFNADIFLGKFDDIKYVTEMKKEFKEEPKPAPKKTLSLEGFNKTLKAVNPKDVQFVLNGYNLDNDQKKLLTELIEKLNKDANNLN